MARYSSSIIAFAGMAHIILAHASCVPEFGTCTMPRDCCPGLSCALGDWSRTTDSTCLSAQSAWITEQGFSMETKLGLVEQFYQSVGVHDKTREDTQRIVHKYRRDFPQLVAKLESKYQKPFNIPGMTSKIPEGVSNEL